MKIELLSDMCCGTGEGNGSNIDVCTTFDEVGLPIIPAKRIKGLLRECGEFFVEHNSVDQEIFTKIFGDIDGKNGKIRIDNAVIEDYENIKSDIIKISKSDDILTEIMTKQSVENLYTVSRAQTSINEKTGIAKKQSLRTTQVIKKGIVIFTADIVLVNLCGKDEEFLENCVKTLRHIGLNKTRGFGEVKCTLEEKREIVIDDELKISDDNGKLITKKYKITLLNDIVISAGSNINPDYISGSMLIGAFAKYTKDYDWFNEIILKKTIFSNAYITNDKFEYTPTPLSIYHEKNKKETGEIVYNEADEYERDDDKQYVQYGGYSNITENKIITGKIKSAIEYHYTTGDKNKNINKNLFTYDKILKGQIFTGTITASQKIIDLLESIIKLNQNILFFGGSASAQYAKCRFEFCEEADDIPITTQAKTIIEFLSDVIVYDEYGNNSSNIKVLENLIKKVFKFEKCKAYSKIVTIGGFNAKWSLPKRQYIAFIKGTVLKLTGCEIKELKSKINYIGALNNEGYGQYKIRTPQDCELIISKSDEKFNGNLVIPKDSFVIKIIKDVEFDYLIEKYKTEAIKNANTNKKIIGISNSCAMRFLAAYQYVSASDNIISDLKDHVNKNFTANKELMEFSEDVITGFGDVILPEIKYMNEVKENPKNNNKLFKEYIKAYIKQIKRRYQRNEDKNKSKKILKR